MALMTLNIHFYHYILNNWWLQTISKQAQHYWQPKLDYLATKYTVEPVLVYTFYKSTPGLREHFQFTQSIFRYIQPALREQLP